MSLQGTLSDFSIADLFQLLGLGQRTGCLRLQNSGGNGEVYFSEGWIIYAKYGRTESEDAVYKMFNWSDGRFDFDVDAVPAKKTMMVDWQNLILEAARRTDELSEIKKTIPENDAILVLIEEDQGNIDNIKLNNGDLKVLSLINGKRTVEEVIVKTGLDNVEASKIVASLIKANLVDVKMSEEEKVQKYKDKIARSGIDVEKNKNLFGNVFKRKKKRKYDMANSAAGLMIGAINRYLDYLLLDEPVVPIPMKEVTDKFEELKLIYPDMNGIVFSSYTQRFNSDQLDWDETIETGEPVLRGLSEILEFIFELARHESEGDGALEKYRETYDDVVRDAGRMERTQEAVLGLKNLIKK